MTRSKKGRAPKLAGEIPDKVRDLTKVRTYWDNGNVYVEPDIDGTYMLQLSLVQRKDVAAYIFSKTDGVAVDFNQANTTLLHELGDLGVKLLAAQLLSFSDTSDAADATDGELHIAITQDGTNPAQYDIATHHPPWITAASIPTDDDSGLVSKAPTSGNPNDVNATGTQVLAGTSNDRAVDVGSTGGFAAFKGSQIGSTTPVEAPIVLVRDPLSSVPFVQIQPSTASDPAFQFPIDGHGTIAARAYAALPTPDASYLSEIIRRTDNPDTFWMCIDTPLGYAWAQFIGPAGANGSNGTNGTNGVTPQLQVSGAYIQVSYDGGTTWSNLLPLSAITGPAGANGTNGTNGSTPLFNSPSVVGLSYGSGPTLVQSGDGSGATPYHQTFGIPAGAPGASGVLGFPALPTYGSSPVSFTAIIPASGLVLPWELPAGYTVQVSDITGFWGVTPINSFVAFGAGGSSGSNNGFVNGQLVAVVFGASASGSEAFTEFADPVAAAISLTDNFNWVMLWQNPYFAAPPVVGYLVGTITITAPAASEWAYDIDLTGSAGTWLPAHDGSTALATYVSGQGYESVVDSYSVVNILAKLLESGTLTRVKVTWIGPGATASVAFEWARTLSDGGSTISPTFYGYTTVTESDGTHVTDITGDISYNVNDYFFIYIAQSGNVVANAMRITAIHMEGTGPYPFT